MGNTQSYDAVKELQQPLLLLDNGSVVEVHLWRVHCEECQRNGRKVTLVLSAEAPTICPYGSDHSVGTIKKIDPRRIP